MYSYENGHPMVTMEMGGLRMEVNFDQQVQERAVLVGLNADCFKKEQTATDETLEELDALLETAGGFCTAKILQNRKTPDSHSFIGEG